MNRENQIFEFGRFRLDAAEYLLFREEIPIPLEPQVFKTLLVLVENAGHLIEKGTLMDEVWEGSVVEEGNLVRNISLLRKALGEGANGEKYIETIPKRGYRFVAEVRKPGEQGNAADEPEPKGSAGATAWRSLRVPRIARTSIVASMILGFVLLLVGFIYWTRGRTEEAKNSVRTSVAVLPFKTAGGESDELLEIAMAEALISKLDAFPQLVVRPLGVVRRYAGLDYDSLAAGRELGVDVVLESTLDKTPDKFRVTTRLLRVRDGVELWSHSSSEPRSTLLVLQNLLSERVAQALVNRLNPEERRMLGKQNTENAEAYQLYLKGRFFLEKVTPDDVKKSIGYFQQAIDKDSNFALAYCGLCASYTLLGHLRVLKPDETFPAAKAALARAFEIDQNLSEAHAQMGFISLHYDYDWPRANKEFQRAIELNPNSPMAHHGRAFYLAAMDRTDEAVAEIKRAVELDPVSLNLNADEGVILLYARRSDDAIDQLKKTFEMGESYSLAARYLARVYGHKRMEKQAFAEYQKWAGLLGGSEADQARAAKAFSVSGLDGYYRGELNRLERLQRQRYVPAFDIARLYALLGDRDSTFEWLGRALEEHSFAIPLLKVDPDFDNVHADPRYSDLIRKLDLE